LLDERSVDYPKDPFAAGVSAIVWGGREDLMRILHLIFAILVFALVLSLWREPAGRVAVIVFGTGVGELVFGVTAVMVLFQSVGLLGEARGLIRHAEAIAITTLVLAVATTVMTGWLFLGGWLVRVSV
jgi:hypothetical protein